MITFVPALTASEFAQHDGSICHDSCLASLNLSPTEHKNPAAGGYLLFAICRLSQLAGIQRRVASAG